MAGKLRIKEVAENTGLSVSTVSRVLAGKANTSAHAKKRVMEYAQSKGILGQVHTNRLLFNHLIVFAPARAFNGRTDVFYYKVVQSVAQAVEHGEVRVSYCGIEETNSDAQLFVKRFSDPSVDAAIIVGVDDPIIHELAADIGKPCVLVNGKDTSMHLDTVSPDHQQIGEYAAEHLIRQGHTDVMVLACLRRTTMERRLTGIKDAFAAHNIEFDERRQLIATSGFGTVESRKAMAEFFATRPKEEYPSAIIACGDFMSAGAVDAISDIGLSVPDDISVMSIDGFNLAVVHDVPLTAVHVPRDELGAEAVRILQRRIMCPTAPFCSVLLNGLLAVRGSVRPARSRKLKPAVSTRSQRLYD
ncbi:LacI family DNA-binding transcriptional regulator [Uliginosibacterium sp. 31-16]|uniref:LacI family DNA-binding transcriptional regulator n=1 Tax=Uliginosibacterium sp. 31-16 TaxID=3068315 RepID=UPI00273FD362|nr:LacI family DNA-binding transcriptional regulator [Uliginosibacterium sp. 31-16]MDP5238847.1 LacI family DNA-binding transcriptional regulator [Uliginosibacterium sp. 31-16]